MLNLHSQIMVFLLPFAGGSKLSYKPLSRVSPDFIEFVPVEIPGRGSRSKEAPLSDIEQIVDDVYHSLEEQLDSPYVIFGHSMGALIGYLLTRKIAERSKLLPLHLFFSGCIAPKAFKGEVPKHALSQDKLFAKLKEMGGMPEEILCNPELMSIFEPLIRVDLKAVDSFKYVPREPFNIPLTVLIGQQEEISSEQARGWQDETKQEISVKTLPGKHFFIFENPTRVVKIIEEGIAFSKLLKMEC